MKHIALLATLDTKSDEARFVADAIRRRGHAASIIDLSLRPGGSLVGDTSRAAVARAAGTSSEAVAGLQRAQAMEVVAAGATTLVRAMVERRQIDAVIGIGGGTGTWMGTAVMRALPIGFPKLMVSTLAGRDAGTDIMVMPSVADIAVSRAAASSWRCSSATAASTPAAVASRSRCNHFAMRRRSRWGRGSRAMRR